MSLLEQLPEAGSDLDEVREAVRRLEHLILLERAAVARMNAAELNDLAVRKVEALERLRIASQSYEIALAAKIADPAYRAAVRTTLVKIASNLLAQAEANLALLQDAVSVVAEALGLRQETGTYDARARMKHGVRSAAGKRA